jgi:hypothetical protein
MLFFVPSSHDRQTSDASSFYQTLESNLPASTGKQRIIWAQFILEEKINLRPLYCLLGGDAKIAARFLWLLSDLAIADPSYMLKELPSLWLHCKDFKTELKQSFASLWRLAGVPEENEVAAIELLFHLLSDPGVNSTMKSRSMLVLFELTKKYPDLKNEFRLSLNSLADQYSRDFKKRVQNIILKLES